MSLIKLSASSENEFGRRLLLGSKHLNGSQMGSLQDLHSASSRAIKTRAEGDLKRAAQNLSLSKTITENLKGKYNSSALSSQFAAATARLRELEATALSKQNNAVTAISTTLSIFASFSMCLPLSSRHSKITAIVPDSPMCQSLSLRLAHRITMPLAIPKTESSSYPNAIKKVHKI